MYRKKAKIRIPVYLCQCDNFWKQNTSDLLQKKAKKLFAENSARWRKFLLKKLNLQIYFHVSAANLYQEKKLHSKKRSSVK